MSDMYTVVGKMSGTPTPPATILMIVAAATKRCWLHELHIGTQNGSALAGTVHGGVVEHGVVGGADAAGHVHLAAGPRRRRVVHLGAEDADHRAGERPARGARRG